MQNHGAELRITLFLKTRVRIYLGQKLVAPALIHQLFPLRNNRLKQLHPHGGHPQWKDYK